MKGKLHFIVFGLGALVGIVMAFVGVNAKSGATEKITAQANQLPAPSSIPTQGDLEKASKLRKKYDSSIDGSEKLLRQQGNNLTSTLTDEPPVNQFLSRANQIITSLEERATALEVKDVRGVQFPEWVKGDSLNSGEEDPFKALADKARGLTNNDQVRPFQIRLVIIGEFLTIAEALLKQPQYANDNGLRIVRFDFAEMDAKRSVDDEQPFVRYPFSVVFDADPRLSAAIMDEFLNPSELTAKSVVGDDPENQITNTRLNFPVNMINYAMRQAKRPSVVNVDLPREKALELKLPADMTSDDPRWAKAMKDLADSDIVKEVRFNLPMQCEIKLEALKLNTKWKAIAKAEEDQ
ncbi:hypothetical protein OAU50_05950 [Planctomycetota bacterium]|nr:hypothetical protein [Planctomycetota bacterium]